MLVFREEPEIGMGEVLACDSDLQALPELSGILGDAEVMVGPVRGSLRPGRGRVRGGVRGRGWHGLLSDDSMRAHARAHRAAARRKQAWSWPPDRAGRGGPPPMSVCGDRAMHCFLGKSAKFRAVEHLEIPRQKILRRRGRRGHGVGPVPVRLQGVARTTEDSGAMVVLRVLIVSGLSGCLWVLSPSVAFASDWPTGTLLGTGAETGPDLSSIVLGTPGTVGTGPADTLPSPEAEGHGKACSDARNCPERTSCVDGTCRVDDSEIARRERKPRGLLVGGGVTEVRALKDEYSFTRLLRADLDSDTLGLRGRF